MPKKTPKKQREVLTVYGKRIAIIWCRAKTVNVWLQDLYRHLFHSRYSTR